MVPLSVLVESKGATLSLSGVSGYQLQENEILVKIPKIVMLSGEVLK